MGDKFLSIQISRAILLKAAPNFTQLKCLAKGNCKIYGTIPTQQYTIQSLKIKFDASVMAHTCNSDT